MAILVGNALSQEIQKNPLKLLENGWEPVEWYNLF